MFYSWSVSSTRTDAIDRKSGGSNADRCGKVEGPRTPPGTYEMAHFRGHPLWTVPMASRIQVYREYNRPTYTVWYPCDVVPCITSHEYQLRISVTRIGSGTERRSRLSVKSGVGDTCLHAWWRMSTFQFITKVRAVQVANRSAGCTCDWRAFLRDYGTRPIWWEADATLFRPVV